MGQHQKHAKLNQPGLGEFGKTEWAILGAPCSVVQQLSGQLIHRLAGGFRLAFVDADHQVGEEQQHPALKTGATFAYTDKISHHQLEWKGKPGSFQFRSLFNSLDGILVNGNHFLGKAQIVILHPKKKESLERKLDRLTNVRLILKTDAQREPWKFLKDHLPGWATIPSFSIDQWDDIAEWFRGELNGQTPKINGLVLAGGKSLRMGKDKGTIEYYGIPQREYLADLLHPFCEQLFISKAPGQDLVSDYPVLEDSFIGLGPYGAILSAFRAFPNRAWLVVACDLPFVNESTIQQLIGARNRSKSATAFYNPATDFPEPLITLWEPRSYLDLLQFLAQGYSCPRKVLINSDIELVHPENPDQLMNVNTPEEYQEAIKRI